jgi:hypothetical protein
MPDTSPEPPRKVALFSGHMIDAPGREKPRFPPDKEPIAARAIAKALSDLEVGPRTLRSAAAPAAAISCSPRRPSPAARVLSSTFLSTSRLFLKSPSISPTAIGAPDISRPRRPPPFMSPRASSARSARGRTLAGSQGDADTDASRLLAAIGAVLAGRTRRLAAVLTIRTEFLPALERSLSAQVRLQHRSLRPIAARQRSSKDRRLGSESGSKAA